MNRTIITLIGTARELTSRQILITLNMNRVQNVISSTDIREILTTAQTRENDVLVYRVPRGYNISRHRPTLAHREVIAKYTPYDSKIIYTYENFRPLPGNGRLLGTYCRDHGIDACWNPFTPVEQNEQMLIDLLGVDKI